MPNLTLAELGAEIEANVRTALREDIGSGDITAQLIPAERLAREERLCRPLTRTRCAVLHAAPCAEVTSWPRIKLC